MSAQDHPDVTVSSPTWSHPRPRRRARSVKAHVRRAGISVALVLAAVVITSLLPGRVHATSRTLVGPKSYYLALGDSLAFGYQPDLNWDDGYPTALYSNLKAHGAISFTNYGCNGETSATSATFINGGCPYWYVLHNYYLGPQLHAALSFINAHRGHVSPVSLDIGANDLLPDINASTCAVSSSWSSDLSALDNRLTGTILPELVAALTVNGVRTGDLVMMNYYDPFQNICPAR
jgi:lysophospholipase L1-like esterase